MCKRFFASEFSSVDLSERRSHKIPLFNVLAAISSRITWLPPWSLQLTMWGEESWKVIEAKSSLDVYIICKNVGVARSEVWKPWLSKKFALEIKPNCQSFCHLLLHLLWDAHFRWTLVETLSTALRRALVVACARGALYCLNLVQFNFLLPFFNVK